MVKIFTVIYILCSVFSTTPDTGNPAFMENISALEQSISSSYAKPPDIPEDYMDALKILGLYREDIKNNDGINRRNAIIRFESMCNMPITGKWNDKCQAALVEIFKSKSFTFYDTVKTPPSSSYWFALNKTTRILTYYQGDRVLKKYPVAVGKSSTQTPSGKFTIVNMIVNPYWGGGGYAKPVKGGSPDNPLGYRWMGLSYKQGTSIGIHGNNSPESIGLSISNGCIRMINSDIEALFSEVEKYYKSGTIPVWVGTDKELEEWGIIQPEFPLADN